MAKVPSQILQLLPIPATALFNTLLSLFDNGKILPSRLLPICAGLAVLIAETIQLINQLLRNFYICLYRAVYKAKSGTNKSALSGYGSLST